MIRVNNLDFTYPGNEARTIKNLNFNIEQGEIFGFLGPSGAGKSTTQKILIGILKGYQGNVQLLGREISRINNNFYERIGVSFESPNLFTKFTARENLDFFSSLYDSETEDPQYLLDLVGLSKEQDKRVAEFSKGMKMRLNFCRAFLNKPEIIFLDEPTSGLDPTNAKNIKDIILQKKAEGRTIFLTTHDMQVADDLCDRVAFIVDGQIELIQSPRQLKIKHGQRIVRVEYIENNQLVSREFNLAGLGTNTEFIDLLNNHTVETIHSKEASLEDVFISVTGRSLN